MTSELEATRATGTGSYLKPTHFEKSTPVESLVAIFRNEWMLVENPKLDDRQRGVSVAVGNLVAGGKEAGKINRSREI